MSDLSDNDKCLTEDYETDREGIDELDVMAKQLHQKGKNIIKQNKRKRKNTPSPKVHSNVRTKAAKKVEMSTTEESARIDESIPQIPTDSPWVNELVNKIYGMNSTMTTEISSKMGLMVASEIKTLKNDFNLTINKLSEEVLQLKEIITQKDARIKRLEKSVSDRDEAMECLERRVDKLERESNDPYAIITSADFCNQNLHEKISHVSSLTNISMREFSEYGSEWKKFGDSDNKIIARLPDVDIKNKVFRGIRGDRNNNCYISEYLTPKNDEIFYHARKFKGRHQKSIHSVFTFKGQVFIKVTEDSTPALISETSNLEKLISTNSQNSPPRPDADSDRRTGGHFNPSMPPPLMDAQLNKQTRPHFRPQFTAPLSKPHGPHFRPLVEPQNRPHFRPRVEPQNRPNFRPLVEAQNRPYLLPQLRPNLRPLLGPRQRFNNQTNDVRRF